MKHGEFRLGAFKFGTGHSVYPSSVQRGGTEWRTHDVESPVADRIFFGTDFRKPLPWKFEFTITGDSPEEATANMLELARAWDYSPEARRAGVEQTLTFNRHGVDYLLYGRARDLVVEDNDAWVLETVKATGIFQPSDPVLYAASRQSVSMTITPGKAGGLIFPAVFPWGTIGSTRRAGVIDAGGGTTPTRDVIVKIDGPIVNPVVRGKGWKLEFNLSLAYDQSVTVNARKRTVLLNNGGSAAGRLSRASRLSAITIPPGASEIFFEGTDRSGTSKLTVSWRNATV